MIRHGYHCIAAYVSAVILTTPAAASTIYNNLTPNNQVAIATRPSGTGLFEIETGDDFLIGAQTQITSASFTGLFVPGTSGTPSITQLVIEMYRIFPADSDSTRTPNVPTRANSPSDVAFQSRDSGVANELTFLSSVILPTFTTLNSIQPGGIHASPSQHTGGNGSLTGQETQINVTFTTPIDFAPGHYFFVPQVALSNGGQFYWLSASRPISGPGTTPFSPDLQVWTRDNGLDPDWLRVGTDIISGGDTGFAFNAAFSLDGNAAVATPEGASATLLGVGLVLIGLFRVRRRQV